MRRSQSKLKLVTIACGIIGLALWLNPWTHYQWAALQNTIAAYGNFVSEFSQSEYAPEARQRLLLLQRAAGIRDSTTEKSIPTVADQQTKTKSTPPPQTNPQRDPHESEDSNWRSLKASNDVNQLREYVRLHPHGKYSAEAKKEIVGVADLQWNAVADSGSEAEIRTFMKAYPETMHVREAELRIETLRDQTARSLQDDSSWQTAKASGEIREFRKYLQSHPNGKYEAEAKNEIVAVSDRQWDAVKASLSEGEITNFIKSFPESAHIHDAEALIQRMYDDFDWVTQQGTLFAYRRYLQRNPNTSHTTTVEKKIIDLEVIEIAAGTHGTLPAPQRVNSGSYGNVAAVCIENGTSYELTVRYSGPDSKKLVIQSGEANSVQLLVGPYTVAASVSAAYVSNFVGSETLQGGEYSSRFYIRSSLGLPPMPMNPGLNKACRR